MHYISLILTSYIWLYYRNEQKIAKISEKCLKNAIMLIQGPQKTPDVSKSAILLLQSHLGTVFH